MKKLLIAMMLLSLVAAPLSLTTGCGTTAPTAPRAKAYLALKDVWTLKDRAMKVYAISAVKKEIDNTQRANVWIMHSKFQASWNAAMILTNFDTTQTAPDELVNITQTLIDLVNNLSTSHK